jgi:GNAT superfamily N-acetyltransferase
VTENELIPLRDRVAARSSLAIPSNSAECTWRPLTRDDASLLTDLAERISRRDHPAWSESLEEMQDELCRSWVTPETDGVLCLDAVGTPIAYGLVAMPPDPESLVRVYLAGGVDPAHRGKGIGRVLLAWQHDRARQLLASSDLTLPAWVMSHAAEIAPEHGALLAREGFEVARYFTTLECEVGRALPAGPVAEGVRVEPFRAEYSDAVRVAKNGAFADHWGSQPAGVEQWESMVGLSSFRPDLSRIALVADEVVGFVTTEVNEDDWKRQGFSSGYIGLVGTVRPWRRRGLASALLSAVLAAYSLEGLERAVLDVDTESPTGALGVYTALGFTPTTRDVAYRLAY